VPGQRFRIEQWEEVLAELGIDCTYVPFADPALMRILFSPGHTLAKAQGVVRGWIRQSRELRRLPRPDVALVFRAASLAGPPMLERRLVRQGIPFVMDFDDAIFVLHSTKANRWFSWLKFPRKTQTLCRLSSHVTVGNAYLQEWALSHNPRVSIIPSSVDLSRFPVKPRQASPVVTVGWTGSHTSQTYLEAETPMLKRFLLANPCARLRVHSDRPPSMPDVPHEWRPWSRETEAAEISTFDIGIMPMPNDAWSRGKCSMKALLYMAASSTAVCSAVGHNLEVIESGVNGILASNENDWVEGLTRLVEDRALRARLGQAGRRTVEQRFSRETCARAFSDVVRGLVQ
jgi:hypothetical protein